MSASFIYVPVTLTRECAVSLWTLTLSKNEWGGQLFPKKVNGQCLLTCDQNLIEGTGLEDNNEDNSFYAGDKKKVQKVLIAVTPFYEEIFQQYPLCDSGHKVNLFFHSHPLLISVRGAITPPSIGDFFAHTLLSNYRNYKQNGQLNTAIVASFEGLYVYFALPHRFLKFKNRVEALWAAKESKSKREFIEFAYGELPNWLIDVVKTEVFNELRDGFTQFMQHYVIMALQNGTELAGAPLVRNKQWNCKGCGPGELNFPFYNFIQSDLLHSYIRENSYLKTLHDHGFHYEFFPAPFEDNVTFLALSKANLL